MASRFVNKRNIEFMIYEVFDVLSLTQYPYFEDHSIETIQMVLDTALKIGTNDMYPFLADMDKEPPCWQEGRVEVHPTIRTFLRKMGQGGWINADKPYEIGGQQLPLTVERVANFIFAAANYSLAVYPFLSAGAANLIYSFGTQEMQDLYLEKLYAGEWQGTMALTEPDVGSSLGDLRTIAEPTDEGYYKIKGKKIFISAGNHSGVDNVIHMMLARIKDAPAGVPGISLFVVPEKRFNENGELVDNDVQCGGIEHKLGYKGSPICLLSMGEEKNCYGYLIGEAGKGLSYMFRMMNGERLNVGMGATAQATAAYYAAVEYAQQRLQGRKLNNKDPQSPMVPLIEHVDIKRMLLFQRAICEGALSLVIQVTMYQDLAKLGINAEDNSLLVDFLVPITKTYPSEMGIHATSAAIQVLGGYGYCGDFPVEQYFRDIRIHPIHEGTTGIQGQDILGRKLVMKDGRAYKLFVEEVNKTINDAEAIETLQAMNQQLKEALAILQNVNESLLALKANGTKEEFLADSVVYLEFISIIAIAWQWLKQAIVAVKSLESCENDQDVKYYNSKLYTCRYFYDYELIKIKSLAIRLSSDNRVTVEIPAAAFDY